MTAIRRIFRPATRLAAAAVALLAGILAAPAAFASEVPPPGLGDTSSTPAAPTVVHTVTVGGTPGWQIALFIVAAAVLAAAGRRAARPHPVHAAPAAGPECQLTAGCVTSWPGLG